MLVFNDGVFFTDLQLSITFEIIILLYYSPFATGQKMLPTSGFCLQWEWIKSEFTPGSNDFGAAIGFYQHWLWSAVMETWHLAERIKFFPFFSLADQKLTLHLFQGDIMTFIEPPGVGK